MTSTTVTDTTQTQTRTQTRTQTHTHTKTPLERLYRAVEHGLPIDTGLFTADVVLDATVPMWRLHRHGAAATTAELERWFADPGSFEEFEIYALPGGALVEFVLTWEQNGVPHACHQSHRLEIDADGRIRRLHAWCGGRWPASLLADMAQAEQASGEQQ